ncbi:MAG: hypothetical protein AAB847_02165 [Patescibacteria group bacterium]
MRKTFFYLLFLLFLTTNFTSASDLLTTAKEAYAQRQKELYNLLNQFFTPIENGANEEVIIKELLKTPNLKIEQVLKELEPTMAKSRTTTLLENLQLRINDVNQVRQDFIDIKLNLALKAEQAPEIPNQTPTKIKPKSFLSRLAQSKAGKFFGFGLRGFSIIGTYYQLKDFTEGTFEEQLIPLGTTIIVPPKIKQPNLSPVFNIIGLPRGIKVENDKAYYYDSKKQDWVRAANPELANRIKQAVQDQNNK